MTCFGLLWTQAAASMEVHTSGRALPENSGLGDLWVSRQMAKSVVKSWLKIWPSRAMSTGPQISRRQQRLQKHRTSGHQEKCQQTSDLEKDAESARASAI